MPEVARQAREVLGIGSSGAFSAACLSMGITLQSDRPTPPDQIEVCYRLMTQPRGEVALNVD